jgi:CBS domain containing-hemolysin-like protein
MDTLTGQLILIAIAILLVLLNGFFVASEFAIVKVRRTRIEELIAQGNKAARRAIQTVTHLDEYLSATQLGITMASLGLGWIGEPAFARLFEPLFSSSGRFQAVLVHSLSAGAAFVLITFLHIVLGELAPKSLAIQKTDAVVLSVSGPLILFYRLSYPFIWALNTTANAVLRLAGIRPVAEAETTHSEEEIRLILAQSTRMGILDPDEERLLERVFEFGDRSVRQIMVPAGEVVFLDLEKSFEENLELARRTKHTRYPLCEGSLDRVVGIIHIKDLFWRYQELGPQFDLRMIKRAVHFVPETRLIKSLLPEFRRTRTHLSIVVDEFGSTVGIVTLEDVLEELVGEIQDEFDTEAPPVVILRQGEGRYLVNGRALIEELERELGVNIEDEENDTIAGHLMTRLGRPARVGDEVELPGGYRARVLRMRHLQITEVQIEKRSNLGGDDTGKSASDLG